VDDLRTCLEHKLGKGHPPPSNDKLNLGYELIKGYFERFKAAQVEAEAEALKDKLKSNYQDFLALKAKKQVKPSQSNGDASRTDP